MNQKEFEELKEKWLEFWNNVLKNKSEDFFEFENFVHRNQIEDMDVVDRLKNIDLKVIEDK